jgi:hypothetical protein
VLAESAGVVWSGIGTLESRWNRRWRGWSPSRAGQSNTTTPKGVRLKFFSFTVPKGGVGSTTVTDARITNDAFVFIEDTVGDFQITPEVVFF